MPVRKIAANQNVSADNGRICIQRGPLVYCAEAIDNNSRALDIVLPQSTVLTTEFHKALLNGIAVITGEVLKESFDGKKNRKTMPHRLTAIPYYAWNHRGAGEMEVWFKFF
jgi:DUF1680 family protein